MPAVRVDMRGSGDSDGLLLDEYLPQEQADAVEVIAWLAAQPWCSGTVGMMGISWGGFNALQVASHRPPALKAIITACSTDDRYADDCHFMGGCLLNNTIAWASTMFAFGAQPPDPEVVGERWRDMWLERLENNPLMAATWIEHQHRDDYWKQGSVCEDYSSITAAVYAVGGWADGYSNAIPRMLAGLPGPKKGLIGPWAHAYPHAAQPGPQIGFLQEALRWWDHWLKGIDTGIMDEPVLRAWMQESVRPATTYPERPGRWIAETSWPPQDRQPMLLHLSGSTPVGDAGRGSRSDHRLQPVDRRHLRRMVSLRPRRRTACRPAPGRRALGLLRHRAARGAHRDFRRAGRHARSRFRQAFGDDRRAAGGRRAGRLIDAGHLRPAQPDASRQPRASGAAGAGPKYRVKIVLNDIAQAFPAGHRIRLALATSHWPIAWPSPEMASLTLSTGQARCRCRCAQPSPLDETLAPFPPPEQAEAEPHVVTKLAGRNRTITEDPTTGEVTVTVHRERASYHLPAIDLGFEADAEEHYRIREGDPSATTAETRATWRLSRGDWRIRTETLTRVSCTTETFEIEATLEAFEGELCVEGASGIEVFRVPTFSFDNGRAVGIPACAQVPSARHKRRNQKSE